MAKLKSSARSKRASAKSAPGASAAGKQSRAEQMQRSIVDSAQQIWLAGVGAFSRAQDEGTKMFEALVKEGVTIEKSTRKFAGDGANAVRDVVEDRVVQARGRATDTWDRLEKVFEQRVQHALNRLGVPGRDELQSLTDQVEALNAELRRVNAGGGTASKNKPARKAAGKKATARKPAAKKASTAKKSSVSKKSAAAKKAGSTRKAGNASGKRAAGKAGTSTGKAAKAPRSATAGTTGQTAAKRSSGRKAIPKVDTPQAPGSNSGNAA